jgi:hypothetical protein
MVLLDRVIEIFGLADLDGRFTIGIDGFEHGEIAAAFVDSPRLGHAILGDRFLKVTPGCSLAPMGAQQKVNGAAAHQRTLYKSINCALRFLWGRAGDNSAASRRAISASLWLPSSHLV